MQTPRPSINSSFSRRLLAFGAALSVVAALLPPASASDSATATATVTVEPKSHLPEIRVLTLGGPQSPVIDALKHRFGNGMTKEAAGKGSVKAERYDLLIVEGKSFGAPKFRNHPVIWAFHDAGLPILAVHVSPAQHAAIADTHTGFAIEPDDVSGHQSHAFLFEAVGTEDTNVALVDMNTLAPRNAGRFGDRKLAKAKRDHANAFAGKIQDQLVEHAGASLPAPASLQSDAGVPPELEHVSYTYTELGHAASPNGQWCKACGNAGLIFPPQPGSQTMVWTMNHTFDVYLQNNTSPQGDYQIIAYRLDGQFTPKKAGESFWQMNNRFQVGASGYDWHLERAWWTGSVGSSVTPYTATDAKLIWQASEPETPNTESTYSSGQDFTVGFTGSNEGVEVSGEYSVHNDTEYSVPDWGVQNQTSGNELAWLFSARNHCDIRPANYVESKCFDENTFASGEPIEPNELSKGQVQIHTSGRWRTHTLLEDGNGSLIFDLDTPITIADTYCEDVQFGVCTIHGRKVDRKTTGPVIRRVEIDASIIVPIDVASVTIPGPANGATNQPVQGTVTLVSPAKVDTKVVIYSNSGNAVVGPPLNGGPGSQAVLTIPKGSTTGTFKIATNANNLGPGTHTIANITAFYAEPTTVQLQVNG